MARARGIALAAAIVLTGTGVAAGPLAPPNDDVAGATELTLPADPDVDTTWATVEQGEPSPSCSPGVQATVWFRIQTDEAFTLRLRTFLKSFPVVVAVYRGASIGSLIPVACAVQPGPEVLDVPLEPDGVYVVQLAGAGSDRGDFVLAAERLIAEGCATCMPACQDGAFRLRGARLRQGFRWSIDARALPDVAAPGEVIRAIRRGVRAIERSANDCHLADRVGLETVFLGIRSTPSSYRRQGRVCRGDARSVVDFGPLPKGTIAETCLRTARIGGERWIVHADIRFNSRERWTIDPHGNCGGGYDIQSVATHELGHAAGLRHVSNAHPELTMVRNLDVCTSGWRSLGLGDVRGLRKLY